MYFVSQLCVLPFLNAKNAESWLWAKDLIAVLDCWVAVGRGLFDRSMCVAVCCGLLCNSKRNGSERRSMSSLCFYRSITFAKFCGWGRATDSSVELCVPVCSHYQLLVMAQIITYNISSAVLVNEGVRVFVLCTYELELALPDTNSKLFTTFFCLHSRWSLVKLCNRKARMLISR